jgi:hypothetical protein
MVQRLASIDVRSLSPIISISFTASVRSNDTFNKRDLHMSLVYKLLGAGSYTKSYSLNIFSQQHKLTEHNNSYVNSSTYDKQNTTNYVPAYPQP